MHELTVIENVLQISGQVAKENNLSGIDVINLDVGGMQHLNEEIMQHGFEAAKKDTVAAGAELKLFWLPIKLRCNSCQQVFGTENGKFYCPVCGSKDTEVEQGMELNINSIEGE